MARLKPCPGYKAAYAKTDAWNFHCGSGGLEAIDQQGWLDCAVSEVVGEHIELAN
jgi:hypothetical protein